MRIPLKILLLRIFLVLLIIGMGVFLAFFFFVVPSASDFSAADPGETSILYDRSGQHILYQVHGEENRKPLVHEDIPQNIRLATIAVEDEHFYSHHGIDFEAIFRAARVNFRQGGFEQGASTITQQLARSVLLSREKTLQRKAIEALLAIKIDFALEKADILDRYLNQIPYGSNAYGIEAASETFFNKPAKELSLGEAALLAALPNAPSLYSPYGTHTEELVARQQTILRKLRANGWITTEELRQAQSENTLAHVAPLFRDIQAPHFVFAVLDELKKKYGEQTLETGGLHIYTTLDWDAQAAAEKAVSEGTAKNASWNASNAALVALDTEKGEILAMVGSKDYFNQAIDGQVNVALAPRQPGSSFKPFVYARAFEKGYQPETILYDLPTNFGPAGDGKDYEPQNYDGSFHGPISMRQALANSLNIPAVQTQYLAGIDGTLDQIARMGITSASDRSRFGLSLALGGAEVSLFQMTQGFGVFSQDGNFAPASGILRIEDRSGQIAFQSSVPERQSALSAETAHKISSILSDNAARSLVFGTRTPLAFPGGGVAAKTGTTQEFRDAWTLGYTRKLAVGVWVGNNDNTPMRAGADGIFVAAPIWRSMMDSLLVRFPPTPFPTYEKVKSEHPLLTGTLPYSYTYYPDPPQNKGEADRRAKEAEEQRGNVHSILYYVNRDEPLSDKPANQRDPMLKRFDEALNYRREEPQGEKKD